MFVKNGKTYAITRRGIIHKEGDFKRDFNVVGSPTISDDGIVSGFSGSNYLTLPKNFNVSGATWEMVFKIRTGNNITSSQSICGHTGSGTADPIELVIKNKKLEVSLSKSDSSYIVSTQSGSEIFTTNTDYFVKMVFEGSAYILSYSTDGQSFIEYLRIANSTQIWTSNLAIGRQIGVSSHFPFLGSIYLKHSYIKINDEYWWSGFYPKDVFGYRRHLLAKKTTKYYKEVSESTTITPKYKCYVSNDGYYLYYNVIDGDFYSDNGSLAGKITTTESDLKNVESFLGITLTIVSISEDSLTLSLSGLNFTQSRSADNDFGSYTTTVTTLIAGTPDDYTYKEETLKYY